MPPKRRSAARTASNSQQSTLSFNGKSSRVTKASQKSQQGKDLDSKKEFLFDEAINHSDVQPETDEPTTADKAIEQQAAVEVHALDDAASTRAEVDLTGESKIEDVLGGRAQPSDVGAVGGLTGSGWVGEEEAHARKITEAQIKKFWREKENARLVPRVHQQDLTVHEKVLREWDVSGQYGVSCPDISTEVQYTNDQKTALHRHRETQALEARQRARPEATNRGFGRAPQGDGRKRWWSKGTESVCGFPDELTIRRDVTLKGLG